MSDPRPENKDLPSIRDALTKAFDEVETEIEEVDDGDESGQSGIEDGGDVHGEGREVEDGDERPGEPTGTEAELGEQEEGGDEEHVLEGSDEDPEEREETVEDSDEDEDGEEEDQGREEGEEVVLDAGKLEAPDFWPDEVKSEFKKMPPKAQEYYINSFKGMQADYTHKMQSIAEVKKAIDPVREELAATGVSEGEMIRRFVAVHKRLEKDPAAAIKWVADLYGVDMNAPAGESKEPPADPRVDRLEAVVTEQERNAAIARAHAVNAQVNELRKAGKMPLYEEAEPIMIQAVAGLQQAGQPIPEVMALYEEVVWRTPALREKHLANSEVAKRQGKLEEKKKNVAKSKRAAGKRTPSSVPPVKEKRGKGSIRDELSRRYDEALRGN